MTQAFYTFGAHCHCTYATCTCTCSACSGNGMYSSTSRIEDDIDSGRDLPMYTTIICTLHTTAASMEAQQTSTPSCALFHIHGLRTEEPTRTRMTDDRPTDDDDDESDEPTHEYIELPTTEWRSYSQPHRARAHRGHLSAAPPGTRLAQVQCGAQAGLLPAAGAGPL